jgi:carboxypeptidase Taq
VAAILGWDEAVMMPRGGGEARADAMATLEGLIHELSVAPHVNELIGRAREEELDAHGQAGLREIERTYRRATRLPQALVEAQTRARLHCEQAWRVQRKANDWLGHLPLLEEVIRLKREEAQILCDDLGTSAYDALMDAFEPGMRSSRIELLFDELAAFLSSALPRVIEHQAREPVHTPRGPFPIAAQRELGLCLMQKVGFDFERGRLDTSHHPFCGGVPEDIRMTTRYSEQDFVQSLMGVLHETGHAKYEQNLPNDKLEPVGHARSMGIHESQSLFQEMQICRSRAFLEFAAPHIRSAFESQAAAQPEAFSVENLTRLYTRVSRGKIRVDADEVTYPLHVILRYRIERGLVEGELRVRDIPELWNEQMQRLLGISTVGDYRDGCMQDVHWPSGALGYFPSYTLGALIAAQLFEAADEKLNCLDAQIARGDFADLNDFLTARIWSLGSSLQTDELIEQATSAPLGASAFMRHIERRYLPE